MEEIKFKGKNKFDKWLIGDLIHNRGHVFIAPLGIANPLAKDGDFEVDENTVGQYTGLKDKNDKEIYEGDIVITHTNQMSFSNEYCDKIDIFWKVFYSSYGKFQINFIKARLNDKNYKLYDLLCHATYSDILNSYFKDIEIVGNIYDNPDLLENK